MAVAVGAAAFLGLAPAALGNNTPERSVRLLVKIREPLAGEIEAALPLATLYLVAGQSGVPQVESFLSRHSVEKLTPVYPGIVKLKKTQGLSDLEIVTRIRGKFAKRANRLHAEFQPPEISRTYIVEVLRGQEGIVGEILAGLKADAGVEFAEEDQQVSASVLPNDPYLQSSGSWGQAYPDLWGILKIGAPAAWDTNTGAGILVAVVDTGIDYNHPDIVANMWPALGYDFIGATHTNPVQSNDPIDHQGHGTHVAGTIAAVGNNGIGVIGVAWNARVMAVKGLDDEGIGLDSTLAPAIQYAADNGADVINASWDGPGYSQTIADAVSYAYNLGAVFVAAAGNDSEDARDFYPGGLWNAITVAASDPNDELASFSNSGSKIDVTAPGVDILSLQASGTNFGTTVSAGYSRASGTSMAAPHVSGLAALILAQNAGYSNEDVRQALRVSATDLGAPGYDLSYGYGRINAAAALEVSGALEAKINAPADGTVTQGVLTVSGVARGTGFASYTLDYGAGALPTTWTTIQTSTTPAAGTLGTFDPSALADGLYDVRLTAVNTAGQGFVDRIQIVVQTAYILSPVPPPAPTSSTTFKNGATIGVTGTAVGATFQNFVVEWAPGLDASSGWQTTGMALAGQGSSPVSNGLLANWDTSSISGAGYYTIRLTANKSNSSTQALTMVYFEPDLVSANWPQFLAQGPYYSAGGVPAANPDGSTRLVVQSPSEGPGFGEVYTLTQSAAPQQSQLLGLGSYQQPAVADLDGNPGEEAAVADSVGIEVVRADGTSYPLATNTQLDYTSSQIVIEDLAGDSHWETLAMGSDYLNQVAYLSAWRADGALLNSNFPIQIPDQNPMNSWHNRTRFLVGDVNGDGKKEIVVQEGLSATTFTLGLFANDGTALTWGVPTLTGMAEAMVAADLDHNGELETILVLYDGPSNSNAVVHVFQPDGTERPGWPLTLANPDQYSESFLAVGDLNRDGHDEIVYSHEAILYVFNADGTNYSSAWPLSAGPAFHTGFASVVIGDIDGDGFPEIVTTLNTTASTSDPFFTGGATYGDEQLLAIRGDGTIAYSWELTASNGYILYDYPAPAIGDFNQNGIANIAVAYNLYGAKTGTPGMVTMVTTGAKFNAAVNDWPLIHQNGRNGNVLQSPTAYTTSTITTVTSPVNPSVLGQQVTFTAGVAALSAGASVPTGQVSFLDGSTSIGSCALAGGSCSMASATLGMGTHTVSAQYGGDAHSTVSVSLPVAQVVNAADFSLGESGPQSVNAGAAAMYTITIAPNPAPFNFAVTDFGCSGLPTGAACAFGASSVTPGGSSATTTLTITTTSRTLAMARANGRAQKFAFAAWGSFGVLGFVGLVGVSGGRKRKRVGYLAGMVLLVCGLVVGCGGGGSGGPVPNPNGTPAGSYTVTVSAVGDGSIAQSVKVALNVN